MTGSRRAPKADQVFFRTSLIEKAVPLCLRISGFLIAMIMFTTISSPARKSPGTIPATNIWGIEIPMVTP